MYQGHRPCRPVKLGKLIRVSHDNEIPKPVARHGWATKKFFEISML